MAQTFVYNTNELSPQGYLKPANTVSAVSPDNVTHLQLRYSDFSSSYVIQGSVVSGENSTFEFSIADNLASEIFKLYYSTDGTTYTVDKTFGGTSGKKLFATADLSGLVTLATAQNIVATKTLTTNANLVVSSGSDITVQAGGDITLADAPTASTDATNKAYVDGLIGYKSCVFWVSSYTPNESTALSYTRIYNNTGYTPTLAYLAASGGSDYGLRITFNRTSSNSDVILPSALMWEDGFGVREKAGHLSVIETFAQSSANTTMDLIFIDDYGFATSSWNAATTPDMLKKYSLSGSTVSESAATSAPGANEWIAIDVDADGSGLVWYPQYTVDANAEIKNFRIELRFYD